MVARQSGAISGQRKVGAAGMQRQDVRSQPGHLGIAEFLLPGHRRAGQTKADDPRHRAPGPNRAGRTARGRAPWQLAPALFESACRQLRRNRPVPPGSRPTPACSGTPEPQRRASQGRPPTHPRVSHPSDPEQTNGHTTACASRARTCAVRSGADGSTPPNGARRTTKDPAPAGGCQKAAGWPAAPPQAESPRPSAPPPSCAVR